MINKRIILISMGILAAAILVIVLIFSTEPTAQSEGATKESAMLVSTVPAKKRAISLRISSPPEL